MIRYKSVRGKSLDRAIEKLMAEMGETVALVDIDHAAEDAIAMEGKLVNAEKTVDLK